MNNCINDNYEFIIDTSQARMKYLFDMLLDNNYKTISLDKYKQTNNQIKKAKCVFAFSPNLKLTDQLLQTLPHNAIIFCGKSSENIVQQYANMTFFSYLSDKNFTKINSKITCEGALNLVISHTHKALFESKALILGYGNLGKQLAVDFDPLVKKLYIATYSKSELEKCTMLYNSYLATAYKQQLPTFDIIINTIPAEILDEKDNNFKPNCFFLDLASTPCFKSTNNFHAVKYYQALGLPDKTAPQTAGEHLYTFIKTTLTALN